MERVTRIRSALALVVAATVALSGCAGSGTSAPRLLVRKEVRQLSKAEVDTFVAAVKKMKTVPSAYDPSMNAYDYFVKLHLMAFSDDAMAFGVHGGLHFLTWHRELLRRFESELRRVSLNPNLTLPYWDWTHPDSTARIFANDFLGGDGDPNDSDVVKTGPFREGEWPIGVADLTEGEFGGEPETIPGDRGLVREIDRNGGLLPSPQEIEEAMAIDAYDVAPYDHMVDPDQSFRAYLEGGGSSRMHNGVHVWVGGMMATGASPNDPVFFLHHANIDRLWAMWQDIHGNGTFPADRRDDTEYRFGIDAESTFNLRATGVRYDTQSER